MSSRFAFDQVFFDVDSTLVTIEGVDELAPNDPEIARLTDAAMNGAIPLDRVYALRLERIRPSRAAIEALAGRYLASIVPGTEETIRTLLEGNVDVHLVTAGIEQAILPLAGRLGIPPRAVHAVRLLFDGEGGYLDFDRTSPLARAGGKELVVLNARARAHGRAAFIGDGISDLETREAVDLFIGFGGVREREKVAREAHIYVRDPTLTAVLPYLTEENR